MTVATMLTEKEALVLAEIKKRPTTADEFTTSRGWYINSWAPTFTGLRKRGLIYRTGEQRVTVHGARAFVVAITEEGEAAL